MSKKPKTQSSNQMKHPSPNEQRAKTAVLLIWIVLGTELILGISTYFEYQLLSQLQQGVSIPDEVIDANDYRQIVLTFLNIFVFIISGVTFIRWFRRAYANLHAFSQSIGYQNSSNYLDFSEGWAAWGWFIPFINLVRPFQIMKELYEEGNEIIKRKSNDFTVQDSYGILILWWVLWIGTGVVSNISARLVMGSENIETYLSADLIDMVIALAMIPLSIITIKIITDYRAVENVLLQIYIQEDENK